MAFQSQALKGKALSLSTYEKGLLALVLAIKKWRTYLLGSRFTIRIDHQSLKYLLEQRVDTPAQKKWLTKLMGYDFIVEYRSGRENMAADALSRRDEHSVLLAISQPVPTWLALVSI